MPGNILNPNLSLLIIFSDPFRPTIAQKLFNKNN